MRSRVPRCLLRGKDQRLQLFSRSGRTARATITKGAAPALEREQKPSHGSVLSSSIRQVGSETRVIASLHHGAPALLCFSSTTVQPPTGLHTSMPLIGSTLSSLSAQLAWGCVQRTCRVPTNSSRSMYPAPERAAPQSVCACSDGSLQGSSMLIPC